MSQPLIDCIEIVTHSGIFLQLVEHEWRPSFCTDCMKFGHNVEKCWAKQEGDMEDVRPKFQAVKRKRRRNRKPRQPRMDRMAKEY